MIYTATNVGIYYTELIRMFFPDDREIRTPQMHPVLFFSVSFYSFFLFTTERSGQQQKNLFKSYENPNSNKLYVVRFSINSPLNVYKYGRELRILYVTVLFYHFCWSQEIFRFFPFICISCAIKQPNLTNTENKQSQRAGENGRWEAHTN